MNERQLKKWSLFFGLFFSLLAAPIVSAACACARHEPAKTDEHFSHRIAENDCHSDVSQKPPAEETAKTDCEIAARRNNCCCAKNGGQIPAVYEKKIVQKDNFKAPSFAAAFDLSITLIAEPIRFYAPEIVYPARSALADKPARAPPVL